MDNIDTQGTIAVVHGRNLAGKLLRADVSDNNDTIEAQKRSLLSGGVGRGFAAGRDSSTFPQLTFPNFSNPHFSGGK